MDEAPRDEVESRPEQSQAPGPELEPAPESESELEPPRTPLYERPFWKATFAVTVVLLILLALWVLPPEYWQF